jgi:hypothetical protein
MTLSKCRSRLSRVAASAPRTCPREVTKLNFELYVTRMLLSTLLGRAADGRPGDTNVVTTGMLQIKAFTLLVKLSGLVPRVDIVSGRCFAGDAVVADCCDVTIAIEKTSLGICGAAMIEASRCPGFRVPLCGPGMTGWCDSAVKVGIRVVEELLRLDSRFRGCVPGMTERREGHPFKDYRPEQAISHRPLREDEHTDSQSFTSSAPLRWVCLRAGGDDARARSATAAGRSRSRCRSAS